MDGIRGIAVLLVLCYHFFEYLNVVKVGWIGVDLFFVLSGFLITNILLESKEKAHYFRNFYIKRVLRIFPLYYFCLFLFFGVYPFLHLDTIKNYAYFSQHQLWFWAYLENWLFGITDWPHNNILNHFWSLAVEEQYYIFWPMIVFLLSYKNIIRVSVFFFIFSFILRNADTQLPFAYMNTFTRLEGLTFGSIIAVMLRYKLINLKKYAWLLYALIFFVAAVFVKWNHWNLSSPFNVKFGYTLSALFFGLLLMISFIDNRIGVLLRRILSNRFLLFSGKISYGLYVYSMFIKVFLRDTLYGYCSSIIKSPVVLNISVSLLLLAIIYIIAYLSYRFLESRFILLKAKFAS